MPRILFDGGEIVPQRNGPNSVNLAVYTGGFHLTLFLSLEQAREIGERLIFEAGERSLQDKGRGAPADAPGGACGSP